MASFSFAFFGLFFSFSPSFASILAGDLPPRWWSTDQILPPTVRMGGQMVSSYIGVMLFGFNFSFLNISMINV